MMGPWDVENFGFQRRVMIHGCVLVCGKNGLNCFFWCRRIAAKGVKPLTALLGTRDPFFGTLCGARAFSFPHDAKIKSHTRCPAPVISYLLLQSSVLSLFFVVPIG